MVPATRSGSARVADPFPSPLATAILAGMTDGFIPQGFIGRADELGRLEVTLQRAEQAAQVVLLAGDAGVGKTRLPLEFADHARRRGVRVLAGGWWSWATSALPTCRSWTPCVAWRRSGGGELLAEVATTAPGLGRLLPGIERSA